ncbi:ABC transporter substrate-binding protein [Dietzia kunjamensis]|uniref:ABC transporter substrate-binding protein n=1 Tax=Dietzia kunjamensis TaxID=322509 RepID=UPI002DBF336E|nr:ABC transporter substrate-binding protein [Dietzia kunjamensis]MEB8324818.1 ABC transporter substrate-binding protein [Dietzia kunjamensis]
MTSRRDLLRLAVGGGLTLAGLTACGPGGESTTTSPATTTSDPLAPPSPIRTPTPDAPPRRLIALSSADLDVLQALDREPTAAWAIDGTGPRPWRDLPAPPSPEWDGPGLPSLRSLLPFGVDAFVLASAEVTEPELRGYEQLATVIVDPEGRPGWRDHLDLVADALDRDASSAAESTRRALEEWTEGQRRLGVDALAVVIGTGARPDTPVATLATTSPLGAEIRALGFDVDSRPDPVPYRDLRRAGVQVVRVDPRDGDLVAAVRQPSVTSLPWALARLVRGRRPA